MNVSSNPLSLFFSFREREGIKQVFLVSFLPFFTYQFISTVFLMLFLFSLCFVGKHLKKVKPEQYQYHHLFPLNEARELR